jgi:ABC-type polysaccharide/polyol phosphate export permease
MQKNNLEISFIYYHLKYELIKIHKGSVLGILWLLVTPFISVLGYIFISGLGRITIKDNFFFMQMFFSLVLINILAYPILKSPLLYISNSLIIKKTNFDLRIFSLVDCLIGFFVSVINFILILIVAYSYNINPSFLTISCSLYLFFVFFVCAYGISVAISSLSLFISDLVQIVPFITNFIIIISPIFYSTVYISDKLKFFLSINPLYNIIENFSLLIFKNQIISFSSFLTYFVTSFLILILANILYKKLEHGFNDVI